MPQEQKKYEFWIDSIARKVVEREEQLNRGIDVIRTESGIGASGIPHVGSMADATRAFGISLGIEELGKKNEYIAFSDSLDGLRKVPSGMPEWLGDHIGKPVSEVPDPFGDCHKNYADHMSSLLIDALKQTGIKFKFISAREFYKKGGLDEQIGKILYNSQRVGDIIKEITGQEKFLHQLPYFPICKKCGQVYTTRSIELQGQSVVYKCDQEFRGENKITGKKIIVKGCGHEDKADFTKGEGKLAWKVDFAARWAALKVSFEAYGKDIADSVKVNDAICKEILEFDPPVHIEYELFLQKGGRKISKSIGNVFTPQVWLNYGTPQSLLLLMFKRFKGTRELDVTDIPKYMDEVVNMRDLYYRSDLQSEREKTNLTRLYEYINLLKIPKKEIAIPYNVLTDLVKVMPEKNSFDFIADKLSGFGYVGKKLSAAEKKLLEKRVELAKSWVKDFDTQEKLKVEVQSDKNKKAIKDLIELIEGTDDGEKMQSEIFEIAKKNDVKAGKLFKAVYRILIGENRGPRLGPYILECGKEEVIKKLKKAI